LSAPIAIRDATRDDAGLLWRMLRLDDHALQRVGGDPQPAG